MSDDEYNQWEEYIHIIYAPLRRLSALPLTFGQDGWHRMAVPLSRRGEKYLSLDYRPSLFWRCVFGGWPLGEHPRIFQDFWGDFLGFLL